LRCRWLHHRLLLGAWHLRSIRLLLHWSGLHWSLLHWSLRHRNLLHPYSRLLLKMLQLRNRLWLLRVLLRKLLLLLWLLYPR